MTSLAPSKGGGMHLLRSSYLPISEGGLAGFPPSRVLLHHIRPPLLARSMMPTEMADGASLPSAVSDLHQAKATSSVIITCMMAASGGLIFGYDIGISGGVTTMEPFLEKFFPNVLRRMEAARPDRYCVYNSQGLTAFTSSLFLAGLAASLVAAKLTVAFGRRALMLAGGGFFLAGAAVNGGAANLEMLILGRILLGFGVGLANQATPVYIAETAPASWRGALTTGFQLCLSIGVLAANLINFSLSHLRASWAWRLALGLAGIPAIFFLLCTAAISSPAAAAISDHRPFLRLLSREYRPQLIIGIAIPLFQQMTGINVIAFYAPLLFQAVGFKGSSALLGSVILALINLVSASLSTLVVDRYGRRLLFLMGGLQMFVCQVAAAGLLGGARGRDDDVAVLILMCLYAAGFGWSWGPLNWVVPSEIFPEEVRSAGQAIAIAVNLGASFFLAQAFLAMLCRMKYGVFIFYAGWIAIMTLFLAVFLPETKGKSMESMESVWAEHWYWKRFKGHSQKP